MTATVELQQQLLQITEVGSVIVTDIVQDEDAGDYVRDLRIFGVPIGDTAPLLVQLRIRSTSRQKLELSAPVQSF